MKKIDAFTVEIISKLFVLNVFADEAGGDPPATDPPPASDPPKSDPPATDPPPKKDPPPKFDVEKIRQEEKAKLYPQITELKTKNEALSTENTSLKTQMEALEADSKKSADDRVIAATATVSQLALQLTQQKQLNEELKTALETTKNQYDVDIYRMEKLHEVGDKIVAEVVYGTTKEEVDASIANGMALYLKYNGGKADDPPKREGKETTPPKKKPAPTSPNPSVFDTDIQEDLVNALATTDMSTPAGKALAKKLGWE